jgi:hypothetical protein
MRLRNIQSALESVIANGGIDRIYAVCQDICTTPERCLSKFEIEADLGIAGHCVS